MPPRSIPARKPSMDVAVVTRRPTVEAMLHGHVDTAYSGDKVLTFMAAKPCSISNPIVRLFAKHRLSYTLSVVITNVQGVQQKFENIPLKNGHNFLSAQVAAVNMGAGDIIELFIHQVDYDIENVTQQPVSVTAAAVCTVG